MLTRHELRQLQEKELLEELSKSSRELLKARMEHTSGTLKETHRLVELKKHIARMKTIMGENMRENASRALTAKSGPAKAESEPASARTAKTKKI